MNKQALAVRVAILLAFLGNTFLGWSGHPPASAAPDENTYQTLPFSQDWSNTSLISTSDDWSATPGIVGYRGDGLTSDSDVDPQTILADDAPGMVDVNANQTSPDTFSTGGIAEFEISDPVVALAGSGTADAPYLLIHIDTTGLQNIQISYDLRDIDGSTDNAAQQVALQYRVGAAGSFTNVPAGYVADATNGPSLATLVTPVNLTLPDAVDNQPQVQIRIMTTNAGGNDEWVGIDNISISGAAMQDVPPTVSSTIPADEASGVATGVNLTINFSENVTVTGEWFGIVCNGASYSAAVTGGPRNYTIDPDNNFPFGAACTVTIYASQVVDQDERLDPMTADYSWSFAINSAPVCGSNITPIHTIQGSGSASAMIGSTATISGLVVGDFQANGELNGFYVQDEAPDSDPTTSEGIFINNTAFAVSMGDRVSVTGSIAETTSLTQLTNVTSVSICSSGNQLQAGAVITMPFPESTGTPYLERFEGMRVALPPGMVVSELYNLARYGEIILSGSHRLWQPTNVYRPGAAAAALQDENDRNRIILDDRRLAQDYYPIYHPAPGLSTTNRVRVGYTTAEIIHGILTYSGSGASGTNNYRLQPEEAAVFNSAANPPPEALDNGAFLTIASFNLLNYFNGPTFPTSRGASTADEFARQRAKTIAAVLSLNASVLGILEMENDGVGAGSAIQDLVDGLNAATAPGTYAYIVEPAPGSDQIKVSIIYKPDVVTPNGAAQNYQTSYAGYTNVFSRPPLMQAFTLNSNGEKFTVVVNHFKSKSCAGASGADLDQGDGQSCYNAKRTAQAQALGIYLNTLTAIDPDIITLGDFNAYSQEDPIYTLTNTYDYINLEGAGESYSYVYSGQSGRLDHLFITHSLNDQVVDTFTYHINADEAPVFDYNTEYSKPAYLYSPDRYRASDHDAAVARFELLPDVSAVYVDANAGRNCEGGSHTPCYASIQDAIHNVRTHGVVYVYPEIYNHALELYKDVTLIPYLAGGDYTIQSITQTMGVFNAPAGILRVKGSLLLNGGAFNPNGGTLIMAGAAPQIIGGNYPLTFYSLTIDNAGGVSLEQPITVEGTLSLSNGLLTLGSSHLTMGATASFTGAFTNTRMIVPTGSGELRKIIDRADPAAITFPVGDNTATADYSPVMLDFNNISGYSALSYVAVRLSNNLHGQNGPQPRLLRYWTIRQSGLTSFRCVATFNYVDNDLDLGGYSENQIYGRKYDGGWVVSSAVNAAANTFSMLVGRFSDFTGGEQDPLAALLARLEAIPRAGWIDITWTTRQEIDCVGFNVYRAESPTAPLILLTTEMIPCQVPGSSAGADYSFKDTNPLPGIPYDYYIEIIRANGSDWSEPVSAAALWPVYLPVLLKP